jgi:SAM-dependent methyltransferase
MLPRTLEPEVMDSREDAWDYDSMDHAEVNRRFVEDLLATGLLATREAGCAAGNTRGGNSSAPLPGPLTATAALRPDGEGDEVSLLILDIGTGTAQIPILLCQRSDDVRIIAADAAVSMLDLARLNVEIAGLRDQIQLQQADAKQTAYRDAMFDAVISNSIVHHIPEPAAVLAEAVRVTKPGGLLFFRDLMRPENNEELDCLVQTYAEGCNDHQRNLFRDSLHAALTVDEMRQLVASLGFDSESVQPTSDRHWTWIARRGDQ